jgi:glucokinase-like ROK family protein
VALSTAMAGDQLGSLVTVLDLVRTGQARTRPEIVRLTGLGRNLVAHRIGQLIGCGLVLEGDLGQSTGGRAPRELRFCADAGAILVAELGATSIGVALSDLSGNLRHVDVHPADITEGPSVILNRVIGLFQDILSISDRPGPLWGIGIGLPGPVEFATGRPVAPPIMPGWDGFDVRALLSEHFDVPAWIDNDVNVMALGELRGGLAQGQQDVIYVKIGTGIGAGLVSRGHLHRGAQGCAGDIGHVAMVDDSTVSCRCGKTGCLEAMAGGAALAREGTEAARAGRSRLLAERTGPHHTVDASDVGHAATYGDPVSVTLLRRSAQLVGSALATLVNFYNPSLILIGGGVTAAGDLYLAEIRQSILHRSLPLATRELQILPSPLGDHAGLRGAAFLVIDQLLSREMLGSWIERRSPAHIARSQEPYAASS